MEKEFSLEYQCKNLRDCFKRWKQKFVRRGNFISWWMEQRNRFCYVTKTKLINIDKKKKLKEQMVVWYKMNILFSLYSSKSRQTLEMAQNMVNNQNKKIKELTDIYA